MTSHDIKYKKLFAREFEILEENIDALSGDPLDYETLFDKYKKLNKDYGSLLSNSRRMTRMGDISQEKLTREFKRLAGQVTQLPKLITSKAMLTV